MKSTQPVTVRKLDLTSHRDDILSEEAAVEAPVTIYVNAKRAATLFATPTAQQELAIGYLIGEGIVKSCQDIQDIAWSQETTSVHIRTRRRAKVRINAAKALRTLSSGCGSTQDFYRLLDNIEKPTVKSDLHVRASEIAQMMAEFNEHSRKFRVIGSFQYAAAFLDGTIKAFHEDVGRHNAIDKVLGAILKMELDPSRIVLVSSGRQSAGEVIKAARVGIPVTVSVRGPIYSGIRAAQRTGITLCCFARGPRMSVYSGFERITFDPQ